jgi:hypothetical protein
VLRAKALWVLLGLYLGARLVVLFRGVVFTSYDTFSYAYRTDPSFDRGPLVSFTGHAPRLWGVPLFYALFPNDAARAYGQWALGTIAWAALAIVMWHLVRHPVARVLASGGVLVVALTTQVSSWDFAILSESLSISLGVLTLALFLWWLSTGSRASLVGFIATGVWWTFTRPDIRVFTVALVVALAATAVRLARRRRAALIAAGILVLAIGWCTAIGPAVERTYLPYSQIGADEGFMYQLRLQVLPDPTIKQIFQQKLGMPECPAADAVAADSVWRMNDFYAAYKSCPDFAAWGAQHRDHAMVDLAKAAPGTYTRMIGGIFNLTLIGAHYAQIPTVLPHVVNWLVFPPDRFAPAATLIGLALALAAAIATRARRLTWVAGLAAACLVSSLATAVFGVGEFIRFGVQESTGLRVAILLLLVLAIDAILIRHAVASDASGAGPATELESVDADRSTSGGVPGQE